MRVALVLRVAILALMTAALVAAYFRPDFLPVVRKMFYWLVPVGIAVIFLVLTLTKPDATGTTPLAALWNRLRGRRWTCPRCGRAYPLDVPLCGDCGELRPEV